MTDSKNKIRCAIYVRCSTSDKQDPEMQRRDLEEYAHARGFDVCGIYEDKGYSGSV